MGLAGYDLGPTLKRVTEAERAIRVGQIGKTYVPVTPLAAAVKREGRAERSQL